MDLQKIGKFIAEQRKAKNLTQVKLAEILHVSEKTISKWECGNGFPDTSLMLPLCEALGISANDLLSGRCLNENEYKENAEQHLLTLKAQQENSTKQLLALEWVIGYMSSLTFIVLIFVAGFLVKPLGWQIALIVFAFIIFLTGMIFALKIERDAGYYQCDSCKHKYIPSFKAVLFSMHYGRTRYLKCPKCHKRTWNKKVKSQD